MTRLPAKRGAASTRTAAANTRILQKWVEISIPGAVALAEGNEPLPFLNKKVIRDYNYSNFQPFPFISCKVSSRLSRPCNVKTQETTIITTTTTSHSSFTSIPQNETLINPDSARYLRLNPCIFLILALQLEISEMLLHLLYSSHFF